jgi:hypothetical protein
MTTVAETTLLTERPGPDPDVLRRGEIDVVAAERAVGDLLRRSVRNGRPQPSGHAATRRGRVPRAADSPSRST